MIIFFLLYYILNSIGTFLQPDTPDSEPEFGADEENIQDDFLPVLFRRSEEEMPGW